MQTDRPTSRQPLGALNNAHTQIACVSGVLGVYVSGVEATMRINAVYASMMHNADVLARRYNAELALHVMRVSYARNVRHRKVVSASFRGDSRRVRDLIGTEV
jgi:hypothetical protein